MVEVIFIEPNISEKENEIILQGVIKILEDIVKEIEVNITYNKEVREK